MAPAAGQADGTDVLLVHRPKYDDWSLPKGKREPGEHVLLTAVREVLEETSVRPVLGPRLPTTEYLVRGRPKQVDYWSATAPGADAAASHEIDAVAWLTLPHAAASQAQLCPRRRGDRQAEAARHRAADPGPARLGRRQGAWPDEDLLRPLDAEGTADALLLADLLACFAPRARVISSPAVRCVDSMRPYAAAFGGSVEAEAALDLPVRPADLSSGRTDPGGSLRPMFRDLVAAGQPAVVCLHRENLPLALAAACSALGVPAATGGPVAAQGRLPGPAHSGGETRRPRALRALSLRIPRDLPAVLMAAAVLGPALSWGPRCPGARAVLGPALSCAAASPGVSA